MITYRGPSIPISWGCVSPAIGKALRAVGLSVALVVILACAAEAAAPSPAAATAFIRTTADRMIAVVDSNDDPLAKRAALQKVIDTSMSTAQIARFCLVLLCHKMRRFAWCWQHGQRMIVRAMAFAMVIRTDVIEFGTWRSGRIGGSSGSVTVG
jgi:hypothetical protein